MIEVTKVEYVADYDGYGAFDVHLTKTGYGYKLNLVCSELLLVWQDEVNSEWDEKTLYEYALWKARLNSQSQLEEVWRNNLPT